ncbi:MAG: hypothetical protein ABIY55_25715 [Kofleriaceae bacterium]
MFAANRTYARSGRIAIRAVGRVQAALLAVVFVLSSLAGLAHEATTRHVQCAEHGEQIHSDAVVAGAPAAGDAAPAVRTQPATAIHGHEHCLMASATRASRIAPSPPSLGATLVASAAPTATLRHAEVIRGVRVYLTAPKTSPPA